MSKFDVKIKICCIKSINEAQLAIRYGADAIGLVSKMPSGPGVISEKLIRKITKTVPATISTFLLTSMQDTRSIINQQRSCGTDTIQICDRLVSGIYQDIRDAVQGISIVQVLHVNGEKVIEEAMQLASQVDAILLDSGSKNADVKLLGGTGKVHDWLISAKIRKSVNTPIFLAGGLTPENVAEAIEVVQPFGVDVCSGIRTNGKLDNKKLAKFISAARKV